ncbi:hypothetical protein HDZ31DRAFT_62303 [Schizophyllum fasciatum]
MQFAPPSAEEQAKLDQLKERRKQRERENYQKLLSAHRKLRDAEERERAEGSRHASGRRRRHAHGHEHRHHRSKGSSSHADGSKRATDEAAQDKGASPRHSNEAHEAVRRSRRSAGSSSAHVDEEAVRRSRNSAGSSSAHAEEQPREVSFPSTSAAGRLSSISYPSTGSSQTRTSDDGPEDTALTPAEAREDLDRELQKYWIYRKPRPSRLEASRARYAARQSCQEERTYPSGFGRQAHARSCATLLDQNSRPSSEGVVMRPMTIHKNLSWSDFSMPPNPMEDYEEEKPSLTKRIMDRMRSINSLRTMTRRDKLF